MFTLKKKKYKKLEISNIFNLGEIEFLRNHPRIIKEIIKRSKSKNINIFINQINEEYSEGGFNWNEQIEGDQFWYSILVNKNTNTFYEKYPNKKKKQINK